MRWIGLVLALGITLGLIAVEAQVVTVPRIAYLSFYPPMRYDADFRRGLYDLGYVEGRNIVIDYRHGDLTFERFRQIAQEVVIQKPDVIVTTTGQSTLVVRDMTTGIPIVMAGSGDAVRQGLAASLSRPGGNVTGMTMITPELSGKRLELLRDALRRLSRVGLLWCPGEPVNEGTWSETQIAARMLNIDLVSLELRMPDDVEAAFKAAVKARADAVVVSDCPRLRQATIIENARRTRMPTMYPWAGFAHNGGFIAYEPDPAPLYRRVATYIDKILKGARPGDLPIEQPSTFRLVVNLKTARALGLTIPPSILLRADQVIE